MNKQKLKRLLSEEKKMKAKKEDFKKEDFLSLFTINGKVTMLHSEFFLKTSIGMGNCLIIWGGDKWQTFMEKEGEIACGRRGLEIFGDKAEYTKYAGKFRRIIALSKKKIIPRFSKPRMVTKTEFVNLLKIFEKFWDCYGYTEFFYHDYAYQEMTRTNDRVLKENLEDLGQLKIEGRKILNALIFEDGVLPNILKGISREFLTNEDDAFFLTSKEIIGLFDGKIPDNEMITDRKKCHVLHKPEDEVIILPFEKSKKIFIEFREESSAKELTGIVASKGKATGKVVVAHMITDPNKIKELNSIMKKGDILVAHSTTPDLMVLISKASAIVADQGGMLSHAAVISRELKIPCIIATKHATKIFSNGDLAEVDAEKGIVRRL